MAVGTPTVGNCGRLARDVVWTRRVLVKGSHAQNRKCHQRGERRGRGWTQGFLLQKAWWRPHPHPGLQGPGGREQSPVWQMLPRPLGQQLNIATI